MLRKNKCFLGSFFSFFCAWKLSLSHWEMWNYHAYSLSLYHLFIPRGSAFSFLLALWHILTMKPRCLWIRASLVCVSDGRMMVFFWNYHMNLLCCKSKFKLNSTQLVLISFFYFRGICVFIPELCSFANWAQLWICRHEKYVTQYRAIFVVNCNIKNERVLPQRSIKPKRGKRGRESDNCGAGSVDGEKFRPVHCEVCSTEVGAIDEDEVYHFFNVLPSESWWPQFCSQFSRWIM